MVASGGAPHGGVDGGGVVGGGVDGGGVGVGYSEAGLAAADAYRGQLLVALEQQEAALATVRLRLHSAASLVGSRAESDWAGTARRLYDIGLAALVSALAVAVPTVDEALTETRRAIATISAGG